MKKASKNSVSVWLNAGFCGSHYGFPGAYVRGSIGGGTGLSWPCEDLMHI